MQRDAWKRYSDRGSWFYEIEIPGYKFNMSDVQAALGLSQLERADALRDARERVALEYTRALGDLEALVLPRVRPHARHAWHLYALQLDLQALRVDRDHFVRALREEGIVASVHFIPYHRHPAGKSLAPRGGLMRTEQFADACVSLPLFPHMSDFDVSDVVLAVRKLVQHYAR